MMQIKKGGGYRTSQQAQAMVEMAILGSLLILTLSTFLTYGQRFEFQEAIKMESFRKALAKAYAHNSSVSYSLRKDGRITNPFSTFGPGQDTAASASASVMWVKGSSGQQDTLGETNFAFFQVNDKTIGLKRYPKTVYDNTGRKHEVKLPVSIWREDLKRKTKHSSGHKKEESLSGIKNTLSSDFAEELTSQLHTRFDKVTSDPRKDPENIRPEYVYQDETYSYDGKTQTIIKYPELTYGAYYDKETNRILYQQDKSGTKIHRQEVWETKK